MTAIDVTLPEGRSAAAAVYRRTLLPDVAPFWLRHGLDRTHGGFLTALARAGAVPRGTPRPAPGSEE